jgi:hypothetical protein
MYMPEITTQTRILRPTPEIRAEIAAGRIPQPEPYDGRHRLSRRISPEQIAAALEPPRQEDLPTEQLEVGALRERIQSLPVVSAPVPIPDPPPADPGMLKLRRLLGNLRTARWRA